MDKIKSEYPVHYLVWNNDCKELEEALKTEKVNERFAKFHFLMIFPGLEKVFLLVFSSIYSTRQFQKSYFHPETS